MTDLSTKPTRRYPSLPDPGDDLKSHSEFLRALRAAVQTHERRDRDVLNSFVRLGELVDLGLVKIQGNQVVVHPTFAALLAGGGGGGGGGGVTDHGALTGLSDDDHTQYVLRSILTTDGDIFYRNAGAIARLGVGSNGDVLTLVDGLPSWAAPSGGGGGGFVPWEGPLDPEPGSPDAMDDEFNDESFDTSLWTWLNQDSATATENNTTLGHLLLATPSGANDEYHGIYQTLPGGTWRFRTKMFAQMAAGNWCQSGIFVRRAANDKAYVFGPLWSSGAGMYIQTSNAFTTGSFGSAPYSVSLTSSNGHNQYFYLDIEFNGTNLIFRWAAQPQAMWNPFLSTMTPTFTTALTVAPGTFLGGNPDQIGLMVGAWSSASFANAYYDWFRRIS